MAFTLSFDILGWHPFSKPELNSRNISSAFAYQALEAYLSRSAEPFCPCPLQRVEIKFLKSVLVPEQLLLIFQKNYDLLLSVFNPEGWLDIT